MRLSVDDEIEMMENDVFDVNAVATRDVDQ